MINEGSRVVCRWGPLKGWRGKVIAKNYYAGLKGMGRGYKCCVHWDNGHISFSMDEEELEVI